MTLSTQEFEFIAGELKRRSGLALVPEKMYLLESRLQPVARTRGYENVASMVRALKLQPNEALMREITESMTTNESMFFRDSKPFEILRDVIMPELDKAGGRKHARIWSAACSTGQEAYSVAITLEEMKAKLPGWTFDIIGTDIADKVVEKAKKGVFSQFEVQRGLPIQVLLKYFDQKEENSWQVKDEIRNKVQFKTHNLLADYTSLGKFDVVLCRNVLIYFDEATKKDVLTRIGRNMQKSGYLLLGSAETTMGLNDIYEPMLEYRGVHITK